MTLALRNAVELNFSASESNIRRPDLKYTDITIQTYLSNKVYQELINFNICKKKCNVIYSPLLQHISLTSIEGIFHPFNKGNISLPSISGIFPRGPLPSIQGIFPSLQYRKYFTPFNIGNIPPGGGDPSLQYRKYYTPFNIGNIPLGASPFNDGN